MPDLSNTPDDAARWAAAHAAEPDPVEPGDVLDDAELAAYWAQKRGWS